MGAAGVRAKGSSAESGPRELSERPSTLEVPHWGKVIASFCDNLDRRERERAVSVLLWICGTLCKGLSVQFNYQNPPSQVTFSGLG